MQRRALRALIPPAGLAVAGCGFKLRGNQNYGFERIAVLPNPGGPLLTELRRSLANAVTVLPAEAPLSQAQVVLDLLQEQREKIVVGVNASGQVREFQLRLRVRWQLKGEGDRDLIAANELVLRRQITVLDVQGVVNPEEELLLYADMRNDAVRQILRRMSALKAPE